MQYQDLREFITELEKQGQLKRIQTEVDAHLEITEPRKNFLKKPTSRYK